MHEDVPARAERVELQDKIVVSTSRVSASEGAEPEEFEFEVVGIVEEAGSAAHYAVCYSEELDEFIVTDEAGTLLPEDKLAQEILNDFLAQASDGTKESGSSN
jgi:hypothetical protein